MEEVYLDDVFELQRRIRRRLILDRKMDLAIGQNPHIEDEEERRALWDDLNDQLTEDGETIEEPQLDVGAFQTLKSRLSGGSSILIK